MLSGEATGVSSEATDATSAGWNATRGISRFVPIVLNFRFRFTFVCFLDMRLRADWLGLPSRRLRLGRFLAC